MIIQDRDSSRRFFLDVWQKYQANNSLQPLEKFVLEVILEHPEYHKYLEDEESSLALEFLPDQGATNPFLHMGMHIAIREQVSTDRPPGIREFYQQGLKKLQSNHDLEHIIMECLGEALWKAQQDNTLPDESEYLECIKKIT